MEKSKKELEEEIQGLNQIILDQKDHINALSNEIDNHRAFLREFFAYFEILRSHQGRFWAKDEGNLLIDKGKKLLK